MVSLCVELRGLEIDVACGNRQTVDATGLTTKRGSRSM